MKDFNDLEPGLYVARGDTIKSIKTLGYRTTFEGLLSGDSESNPSVAKLAATVAWVFIALEKRKSTLLEIPYTWTLGDDETEAVPFNMPFKEQVQQIDESMQLYAQAFLLKRRGGTGAAMGVRWLNPLAVEPDYDTATPDDGIVRYKYTTASGQEVEYSADDIIRFVKPGMDELRPGTAAAQATSDAAAILRGISQTTDTFYDNNALPVMLVKVPAGTAEQEVERTENAFRRLFNKMKSTLEVRVQGIRADVEVITLSFEPEKLGQIDITAQERDAILAAHDIPKSMVLADAATYATATQDKRNVISSVGARFEYVADVLNTDPDFEAAGWALVVKPQEHEAMKEDEARRSESVVNYTGAGYTLEAASWLMGINADDFPPDMVVFTDDIPAAVSIVDEAANTGPQTEGPQTGDVSTAQEVARERQQEEAKAIERRQFKNWLHKRKSPDPTRFEAVHLSDGEKALVYLEEVGFAQDATFHERDKQSYP